MSIYRATALVIFPNFYKQAIIYKTNYTKLFFLLANESLQSQSSCTIWIDAYDWYESFGLVKRSSTGDQT
jgi:hypothetical protein